MTSASAQSWWKRGLDRQLGRSIQISPFSNVFVLHGHIWPELPYAVNSTLLKDNNISEFTGAFMGIGPSSHFDALLRNGAGGKFRIPGFYLWKTQQSFMLDGGIWGLFHVQP